MRIITVTTIGMAAALLGPAMAGCSADAPTPAVTVTETAAPGADPSDTPAVSPDPVASPTPAVSASATAAECAQVPAESMAGLRATVDVLAGLDLDTLEDVAVGDVVIDLDAFDADVNRLRMLSDADTGGLGDVGEALDLDARLSQAVRGLVARGDQATQADVDAYEQQFGGADGIVAAQVPIIAAYDAACG